MTITTPFLRSAPPIPSFVPLKTSFCFPFAGNIRFRCFSSEATVSFPIIRKFSNRHLHKRLPLTTHLPLTSHLIPKPSSRTISYALHSPYSSLSETNTEKQNPVPFKALVKPFLNFSLPNSPFDICKWAAIVSIIIAVTKRTLNLLFSPFFWMYFSWTWLFWPWMVAIVLAIYGIYCIHKHSLREANIFEQLAIVTSAITWLTLVPPAHFNGFLEGWPIVFFFAYHYFFFFDVSVRKRLYGDLYPREHDPKWDISLPSWSRLLFSAAVMVAHWLAAAEGPELHLALGGWFNFGIWVLIITAQFLKYHSILYLSKYSEKVLVPTAVAQFGPYRWVRHPIYASTMLLFAAYFVALRAPLSLLFLIGVCLVYYDQKVRLEEGVMVETFAESYTAYASKVRYKFIPLVY